MQAQLTLITTVIETILYTGIVFGWSSLQPTLVKEGYFSELCQKEIKECEQQSEAMNLVFAISTATASILSTLCGILNDRKGSWFSRTIFLTLSGIGFLLTAVSKPGTTSWLLYISFPLQSIASYGLLLINFQVCNLSTKFRAITVSTVSGAFGSASFVLQIIKYLNDLQISISSCFYFLSALSFVFHLKTFLLTPKMQVPFEIPDDYIYGYRQLPCFAVTDVQSEESQVGEKEKDEEEKSVKECLKEKHLWTLVKYFSLVQFMIIYNLGAFFNWIDNKFSKEERDISINILAVSNFLSVFTAVGVGILTDQLQRLFSKTLPKNLALIKAVVTLQLVNIFLLIIMFACMLIGTFPLANFTAVLLSVNRCLLYSTSANYVAYNFPTLHFGFIHGLMITIGGLILLMQYPLTLFLVQVLKNNFDNIFVLFLIFF